VRNELGAGVVAVAAEGLDGGVDPAQEQCGHAEVPGHLPTPFVIVLGPGDLPHPVVEVVGLFEPARQHQQRRRGGVDHHGLGVPVADVVEPGPEAVERGQGLVLVAAVERRQHDHLVGVAAQPADPAGAHGLGVGPGLGERAVAGAWKAASRSAKAVVPSSASAHRAVSSSSPAGGSPHRLRRASGPAKRSRKRLVSTIASSSDASARLRCNTATTSS
jgi:hypothetical protein